MREILVWCMFNFMEPNLCCNRFCLTLIGCILFSRVDVCVGAKSQMFLERYGGDGCDCDDERMMTLMLFVAMAMRMKNDFASIFLLLMMVIIMMMTLMTIETFLHMIVSTVMMASVMIIVMLRCFSWRCCIFSLNFFPDVFFAL